MPKRGWNWWNPFSPRKNELGFILRQANWSQRKKSRRRGWAFEGTTTTYSHGKGVRGIKGRM